MLRCMDFKSVQVLLEYCTEVTIFVEIINFLLLNRKIVLLTINLLLLCLGCHESEKALHKKDKSLFICWQIVSENLIYITLPRC
jgi:hypothetical protein